MGYDRQRPVIGREGGTDAVHVMTVDFNSRHAEGAKLVCQGIEVGHLAGGTETLHAIQIDNEREIAEVLVGEEYERFPTGALVPFTIRSKTKDSAAFSAQLLSQRQACGETEAVAQAAGGEDDLGNSL